MKKRGKEAGKEVGKEVGKEAGGVAEDIGEVHRSQAGGVVVEVGGAMDGEVTLKIPPHLKLQQLLDRQLQSHPTSFRLKLIHPQPRFRLMHPLHL